jgi:hypothetical protein
MTAGQPGGEVEQSDQVCRHQTGVTRTKLHNSPSGGALLRCIIFSNCVAELVNRRLSSPSDHVRSGSGQPLRWLRLRDGIDGAALLTSFSSYKPGAKGNTQRIHHKDGLSILAGRRNRRLAQHDEPFLAFSTAQSAVT